MKYVDRKQAFELEIVRKWQEITEKELMWVQFYLGV